MSHGLSKSRLLALLQCERKLWLSAHRPDLEVTSAGVQGVFDTGHEVGEFARRQESNRRGTGVLIDVRPHGWAEGVRRCVQALAAPGEQVLFEAPFVFGGDHGVGVLVDIVVKDEDGALTLIEVKSSTGLKGKPYLEDAAIQAWTMTQAGYPPDRVLLRLLDSQWVYAGDSNHDGLFVDLDVTAQVRERFASMAERVQRGHAVLGADEPPIEPGAHCTKPFACGFARHCGDWDAARKPPPVAHPVHLLLRRNMGRFSRAEKRCLTDGTYLGLANLPPAFPADERTRALVRSVLTHQAWVSAQLATMLAAVPYPRYHFDFETISWAVPRWRATRPYQQVSFQWSCHVEHADGRVEHHEFLDLSGDDPREACAREIIDLMGRADDGVVVVYAQSFEQTRLREMARDLPHHAAGLHRVMARLYDLLPVLRTHYYHPAQGSSWSIKQVLPTVAPELDYASLVEVQDGGSAQRAYLEAIAATEPARKAQLRERMLAYCERDTEAMLRLMRGLTSTTAMEEGH